MADEWAALEAELVAAGQRLAPTKQVRDLNEPPLVTSPKQQGRPPGYDESAARGVLQAATLGFGDEISAAIDTVGLGLKRLAKGTAGDPLLQKYQEFRDAYRERNEAAKEANPKTYLAGEAAGGLATIPGGVTTLGGAAKAGIAIGAAAGLGGSKADLTKGEIKQAAGDTAIGGAVGGTLGAAAKPLAGATGAALGKIQGALTELGETRLFKAAVGQTKRAYTQMDAKGLLDKAGQYLNKMGIGWGDSTESIAQKLAGRKESVGDALQTTVAALDDASGGKILINPSVVAAKIEAKVAAPLKKLAAARGEYAQVLDEAKAIREIGEPLTFAQAVEQRAAAQKQINYDVQNGRDIAAQARREIAQIWNDEIDKNAEGLLRNSGKAGDAYRELRHEYSLTTELLKHVSNRAKGNAANRVLSPSDYGVGGVAGIMTSNPFVGAAGAIANHVARVYGNAAAGRTAINMAKVASVSKLAAEKVLPKSMLAARVPIAIGSGEDEVSP